MSKESKMLAFVLMFLVWSSCACFMMAMLLGGEKQIEKTDSTTLGPTIQPIPEAVGNYVELVAFEGSGITKTDIFKIEGDKSKFEFDLTDTSGFGGCYFGATVLKQGQKEWEGTMIANETVKGEKKAESINYTKGEQYISINSANCAWKIKVYDFK